MTPPLPQERLLVYLLNKTKKVLRISWNDENINQSRIFLFSLHPFSLSFRGWDYLGRVFFLTFFWINVQTRFYFTTFLVKISFLELKVCSPSHSYGLIWVILLIVFQILQVRTLIGTRKYLNFSHVTCFKVFIKHYILKF